MDQRRRKAVCVLNSEEQCLHAQLGGAVEAKEAKSNDRAFNISAHSSLPDIGPLVCCSVWTLISDLLTSLEPTMPRYVLYSKEGNREHVCTFLRCPIVQQRAYSWGLGNCSARKATSADHFLWFRFVLPSCKNLCMAVWVGLGTICRCCNLWLFKQQIVGWPEYDANQGHLFNIGNGGCRLQSLNFPCHHIEWQTLHFANCIASILHSLLKGNSPPNPLPTVLVAWRTWLLSAQGRPFIIENVGCG